MEQRRPCIGIDLGTAYTRTASFDGNQIKMIPDQFGESAMPSYVTFTDSGVLIGRAARTQAPQNPANTIFDVIRLIGTRYSDPSVQNDMRLWPFKVVAGPDDMLLVEVHWKGKLCQFTPVEIYSMILTQIKENAQAAIGAPIRDAAVTVLALFDYQQRQAIKEAGMIAGLNILQIVSSPAATALYYGLERSYRSTNMFNNIKRIVLGSDPVEHNIIIFDLGAGTLDVAVVTIKGNACKVQATAGDVHLGGADFDNNLVEYFVNSLKLMSGREDISISPSAISNLRMLCEEAKISLSSGSLMAPIKIAPLYSDVDLDSSITEAEFIELNSDLFSKCIRIVDTCLMDAGISIDTVHEVILVGASTRIPIIQNCMKRWFPDKTLTHSQNLEATTSYGVALQAFFLSTRDNWKGYSLSLQDATPFSLGIKGSQGTMCILVPKNTNIPFKMERTFRLTRNSFLLEAYEGEGTLVSTNKLIGKFELSAVHIAQNWNNIKICFEMLENGVLKVVAEDIASGTWNGLDFTIRIIEDSKKRVREALRYEESEKSRIMASTSKSITSSATSNNWERLREKPTVGKLLTAKDASIRGEIYEVVISKENGGLTKEDIEKMSEAAASYKADDEEQKARVAALLSLENLAYKVRALARNLRGQASYKKSMEVVIDKALTWLDTNRNAGLDHINDWKMHLETVKISLEEIVRVDALNSTMNLANKIKAIAKDPGVPATSKKSLEKAADDAIAFLETNYDAAIDEINAWKVKLEIVISKIVYLGTSVES